MKLAMECQTVGFIERTLQIICDELRAFNLQKKIIQSYPLVSYLTLAYSKCF